MGQFPPKRPPSPGYNLPGAPNPNTKKRGGIQFFFKKDMFGNMILMLGYLTAQGTRYRKANEGEAQMFKTRVDLLFEKEKLFKEIKENHPELFI